MHDNGPCGRGLAELNPHVQVEKKEVREGVTGEGQGLSEEDESRIIEEAQGVNGRGQVKPVQQAQVTVHRSQQQTGQVQNEIHWERFLPIRSLKVLLVENDDSTRHVVKALLRNCSYEVTAVSNGLQAWKVLEDSDNHIDLVLTELVMPGLSGIGLLSKIITHKTCQSIPVIMMSSHDSMGIVFKCLSKGAVDFLVKPIRKNELKNLWQHVWRKCHSSSASWSGSGIRTQKSTRSGSSEESDNNSGSSDEGDNRSLGFHLHDGSDDGSGTQTSWTKRAVEIESPPPRSPWEELADPPDSTCAQVIHSRPEAFASSWVPTPAEEHGERENQLDNVATGKDLDIGVRTTCDSRPEEPGTRTVTNAVDTDITQFPKLETEKDSKKVNKGTVVVVDEKLRSEWTKKADDLTGADNNCHPQRLSTGPEVASCLEIQVKAPESAEEVPSLELSLKRLGETGDVRPLDQNVLRHSELSAFTRYKNGSTVNPTQTGNVGSCSLLLDSNNPTQTGNVGSCSPPLDHNSAAVKTDSMCNLQSNTSGTPPNQVYNSSSNNDTGSTSNKSITKPPSAIDNPATKSTVCTVNSSHPPAFQSVQRGLLSTPQLVISGEAAAKVNILTVEEDDGGQKVWVQHHHHHYHHHHLVHSYQQLKQISDRDDLSVKDMAATAQQCGSSNAAMKPTEFNIANCSLNGSGSGSNHGSNMQNGSSTGANPEQIDLGSDNGMEEKGLAGDGSGSAYGIPLDQNRSALREAALNKFRQKRKDRCFEKKVRYQSRKKLAEQRPRVRGQFVRQVQENSSQGGDS